jgi:hypothetical protein
MFPHIKRATVYAVQRRSRHEISTWDYVREDDHAQA